MGLVKTATMCMVLALQSYSFAATVDLLPKDQAISCNEVFRCGEDALGPGLGVIPGVGPVEQRSAIEFSLAGVVGITAASLELTASRGSSYSTLQGVPVIEIYGYPGDGVISYSDLDSGTLLFSRAITAYGPYSFDVTTFATGALENGWSHVGFSLRDVSFGSAISFGSNGYLKVTAATIPPIPEPNISVMLLAGLVFLSFAAYNENNRGRKLVIKGGWNLRSAYPV